MKKSTLIKQLQKRFPDIRGIKCGEDWGAGKDSIHLGDAAEGGEINGLPAADYYNEFQSSIYDSEYGVGVHERLAKFLRKNRYSTEWYDAGTLIAYPE